MAEDEPDLLVELRAFIGPNNSARDQVLQAAVDEIERLRAGRRALWLDGACAGFEAHMDGWLSVSSALGCSLVFRAHMEEAGLDPDDRSNDAGNA